MHSDARECGRWWGLAEFATGKAIGMEDRVPTGTGSHGLPSASLDLPPKGLPHGQSPHTQAPQDPWGRGDAQGPDSTHDLPLSPGAVGKML